MGKIHNPHDTFFKAAMTNVKVATEFLQHHLPGHLQSLLALETLDLQSGTYINQALEISASDLLFKVNYKEELGYAYIYVLIEHQSYIDNLMPFRTLEYITSIWREIVKKDEQISRNKNYKLPLIIPLVFYNGSEKYDGPKDIKDLIAAPSELIDAFLLKPFELIDLNEISDAEMKDRKWAGVLEFLMRHIHEKEALNYIQSLMDFIRFVFKEGATDLGTVVLKYFLCQSKTANPVELTKTLKMGLTEDSKMGTLIDYLVEEKKGAWLQEGVQTGEKGLFIRQLEYKFKTISPTYRQKIQEAGSEPLLKWSEKILESQSLEEVFE